MVRRYLGIAIGLALAVTLVAAPAARSQEPPNYTFAPAPPGTVVQSTLFYLTGQAMHSQWRAVVSKKTVGTNGNQAFDQWYLSIYSIDNTTYRLRYRSPGNGGPLWKVERAHGATMWFPMQEMKIVGTGQFMEPTVENLVTSSHQTGADCGAATITVFAYNPKTHKVVASATVTNGCDLSAKIVKSASGAYSLALTGPYYSPTAAMCCPTKNKAAATLRYANGRWVEYPKYFKLSQ